MPTNTTERYLRQLGSGHLYAWTPTLAKRHDMQEIDPESAKVRIDALREQMNSRIANIKDPQRLANAKARIETITKLSKELSMLEGDLSAAEQVEKQEIEAEILGEKPALRHDDIDTSRKGPIDPEIIEEERKGCILTEDKEYQGILAMKTKQEVIEYLAANFGVKEEAKQPLEKLRFVALEKRKERIFEV
jgi:hypothetical protein